MELNKNCRQFKRKSMINRKTIKLSSKIFYKMLLLIGYQKHFFTKLKEGKV